MRAAAVGSSLLRLPTPNQACERKAGRAKAIDNHCQSSARAGRALHSANNALASAASVIAALEKEGELTLERVAVGDHILLGGDNMDLLLAHVVGMFGLSIVTGWLTDRWGQRATIGLGGLLLIASCALAPQNPDTLPLAVSLFLLGLGWNMCFVSGSSLLTNCLLAGLLLNISATTERGQPAGRRR